jgi:hypothetical protein
LFLSIIGVYRTDEEAVMKRLLLPLLVLFLLSPAFTQDLKIYGGADWSRYNGPGLATMPPSDYSPGSTWAGLFGAGISLPLLSGISADVGLQYFGKGSKDSYVNPALMETFYETYRMDVLSLPVCIKFKPLGEKFTYILGGGEFSYVLKHSRILAAPSLGPTPTEDILNQTKRFDFGLVLGCGVEVATARRWGAFVEVRYYLGLVDLHLESGSILFAGGYSGEGFKTRALALQAGIKYRLGS